MSFAPGRLGGTIHPEGKPQHLEDGNEAVQPARRLAVLDLVDHASADAGGKRELILAQAQRSPRLADLCPNGLGHFACSI